MTKQAFFILFLCVLATQLLAQQNVNSRASSINTNPAGEKTIVYYGQRNEAPRAIEFTGTGVSYQDFATNINQYLNVSGEFAFVEKENNIDQLGIRHHHLQQYYKGIALEGMGYRVHEKNGVVTSANGKAMRAIQVPREATLSERQCFQLAIQVLQTKDTTNQRGKKLIVSKGFTFLPESFSIAYQFEIDISLTERWRVSIDASTGELLNKVSLVQSCFEKKDPTLPLPYGTATGLTNYYGRQTIQVEKLDESWSQLTGQTPNGGHIATHSFNNASVLAWIFGFNVPTYIIYSNTNTYDEPYHRTAVSVQWAAEQTYEYFFTKHGRNSYDNAGSTIRSLVHVDQNMNNAFWSRNTLLFGDGSNNNPLVELDVVGHEFSHGVTQFEAQLNYQNEPGALNESFSDIFGKAIEFNSFKDTATWQLAKYFQPGGIRDFSNPNLKQQPDTWMGDLWYTGYEDSGGVHYNSGVQNFWYYLLCKGGSGVNDRHENYSVSAIGMEAATKIAYRNLTEYLGYFSDYLDSRIGSLLATADLYGKNSMIYQQVANAWDAVGVIDKPIINSLDFYDITGTTVKIKGNLIPRGKTVNYYFEYGTSQNYGSTSPVYQYAGAVVGELRELQSSKKYYVKLVATNENGSSAYLSEFNTVSLAPMVNVIQTVDVTESNATLFGEINPNSLSTTYHFEYGLTPSFGISTATFTLKDTTEFISVSVPIFNLQPRQTYYYKLVASNGFSTVGSAMASLFTSVSPKVFSFSPTSGVVGSEVIIEGDNFHATAELNAVNFGATRATVLSASKTQLKVRVPGGASLAAIEVLDIESGRSGKSIQKFVPTFQGGFNKNELHLAVGIDAWIYQTIVEDMDGDGRPDIIARHYVGFSVFQNVHQGGDLKAESFVRNIFNTENTPGYLYTADFDGNGLNDIAFVYSNGLRIYPNLSVPGFVFFGPPVDLPHIRNFWSATFEDFDLDGHVDIAVSSFLKMDTSTVTIFRNENPKGFVDSKNFKKKFSLTLPQRAIYLEASDLDNDGKPDLIASAIDKKFVSVLKNESTPGAFAFSETQAEDLLKARYARYTLQDFNQDGWADVLSYPLVEQIENMTLLENKRNSSSISMAPPIVIFSGYSISGVVPSDITGDGKVDLMVGSDNRRFLLLKNNSVAAQPFGSLSFERYEEYGMKLPPNSGTAETNLTINDLNGDGRPEIINANSYYYFPRDGYNLEIWQNAPPNCPDPSLVDLSVSNYNVTLKLPANLKMDQLEVAYSYKGSYSWSPVTTTQFSVTNSGSYQLKVRAKCYLDFTEYVYKDFATDCIDVSDFSIVNIQPNTATVQAYYLNSIEVQYSPANQNLWLTLPQSSSLITNLKAGTNYDVRYRGRCATPVQYNYKQFTTLCPKLTSITITELRYNSAKVNWTGNSTGTVLLEYSSDNINWNLIAGNQMITSLKPAQKYFVRGKMLCTNITSDWVSTSFVTPCPKVSGFLLDVVTPFGARISWSDESNTKNYFLKIEIDGRGLSFANVSTNFYELNGLKPGTRCRISVAPECLANKEFVDVEFTTICFVPSNLSVSNISHTSAIASWSDSFGGVPYTLNYSIAGSGNWNTIETAFTSIELSKLRPATEYEIKLHITCASVPAQQAKLVFKTGSYAQTTLAPNPSDHSVTVFPSQDLIGKRFYFYDNMGKLLATGNLQDYTIDLSGLNPGIYNVVIDGERPMKMIKL
jgi:Zn-dependent metalloprotease